MLICCDNGILLSYFCECPLLCLMYFSAEKNGNCDLRSFAKVVTILNHQNILFNIYSVM
jgi:hypothetical protein